MQIELAGATVALDGEASAVTDAMLEALRANGGQVVAEAGAADILLVSCPLSPGAPARPPRDTHGRARDVAMAMAAVRNPRVLLLDEHVSALDPKRAKVVAEVTEQIIRAQSMTTIMVTHDLGHALAHSDRVLMMHRGRVVMDLSGKQKSELDLASLAASFEELVGEALPDRTILAAAS